MRRLLAILLLAAIGLPFAAPLLALGMMTDAGLPACCRRNGEHHCAMSMGERAQMQETAEAASKGPHIAAPPMRCPYCPQAPASAHPDVSYPPAAEALYGELQRHPAVHPQTECRWRMARERARQKRGPPLA